MYVLLLKPETLLCYMPGGRLWVDLTQWFFSVYEKPYDSLTLFVHRHKARWETDAQSAGVAWGLQLGALPRACLATLWNICAELSCSRSLPSNMQNQLVRWASHLWLHCPFTGRIPVAQTGVSLAVEHGYINAKVAVEVMMPCRDQRSSVLKALVGRQIFLEKCPLPVLTFCLRRHSSLLRTGDENVASSARALDEFCVQHIEDAFLSGSASLLAHPPSGSVLRHMYGKNRQTVMDPRSQARSQHCQTIFSPTLDEFATAHQGRVW
jgi:hypothetical protein